MSVFDAIKNNVGNTESGIFMSYVTYEQRLREAQAEERERIVALLNSHRFQSCNDDDEEYCLTCNINLHDAIDIIEGKPDALIKGENE